MTKILSKRQVDVLVLMADGLITKEIAAKLGTGCGGIKASIVIIKRKLGAISRPNAVKIGIENGYIQLKMAWFPTLRICGFCEREIDRQDHRWWCRILTATTRQHFVTYR